jgi:ribulose-phosphate 3-epimerase
VDLPRSPVGERPIEIAPSVLPADFSRLGDEVVALEKAGVDRIQWDVMDGHFVPNLTFGPDVIAACRPHVTVPFEAHLMVDEPDALMARYVEAGCDLLIVHAESTRHLHRSLGHVRDLGARAAVALNPATPASAVEDVLDLCAMVLVMTVNPGFGGQDYIATMEPKVRRVRQLVVDGGHDCDVEVDGGIGPATVQGAATAGANVLVAGSALYRDPRGLEHAVTELRELAAAARHPTDDPAAKEA